MRKVKIITIEGVGEVTVKEVSPYAVYSAMSANDTVKELEQLAADCISLPQGKELIKLYGSELDLIVEALVEVNSYFLSIPAKLGLKPALAGIVSEISKILPPLFADSYKTVMAKMPGITAGAAS